MVPTSHKSHALPGSSGTRSGEMYENKPLNADATSKPKAQALRWINTTSPEEVKEKSIMKIIRAHALKNSEYHQKRTKKAKATTQSRNQLKGSAKPKLANPITHDGSPVPMSHGGTPDFNAHPSPGNSSCSSSDSSESLMLQPIALYPSPFRVRPSTTLVRRLSIQDLLNPDAMETNVGIVEDEPGFPEDLVINSSMPKLEVFRNLGSAIDPFRSLPQFLNPHVKAEQLQYFCTMLRNDTWGAQHEKLSMNSRLVYLSSICAGAAYREAFYGISGESLISTAVKAEVINMINERLRDPVLQADDETIAAVCHMINFEVFHSEPRLVTHIRGVEQLILQRGGLDQFASKVDGEHDKSAELLTRGLRVQSRVMGGLLVNELRPDPRWQLFVPPPLKVDPSISVSVPESPAHGIRLGSSMLRIHCAPELFKLLCDMQQLTNVLFDLDDASKSKLGNHERPDDKGTTRFDLQDDHLAVAIFKDVLALPSAALPNHRLSGDWIFECCRLLSLIYATAVIHRVPFSAATPLAADISNTPRILLKLYAALRRTDLANCWGTMSGCLFWVTTVACPAAHLPDGARRTPEEDLAKKWFIMMAIRANSLPAQRYGHGDANDAAMRLLHKVQAAISR